MSTFILPQNPIKFRNDKDKDFLKILIKRITEHFKETQTSKHADRRMWSKIIFWLASWSISLVLMYSGLLTGWGLFAIAVYHGLTHLFIAFNISHDANHFSISPKRKVNLWLSYTLDLIGVSSRLWRVLHNDNHHSYVNVEGIDNSIEGFGIFRFSPNAPRKKIYRFQYLYWPFVYAVSTLNYVLMKDYIYCYALVKNKDKRIKTKDVIALILGKLLYYSYTIIGPIFIIGIVWWKVALVFVGVHFLLGITLALIFQMGHLTEETGYSNPGIGGTVENNWAIHILASTGDFAGRNPIVNWLFGGINTHVIHHLLPKICHTHYPDLVPIVRQTAHDFGIPYREIRRLDTAIVSHVKHLKEMGEA